MALVPPLDRTGENEAGLSIAAKAGNVSLLCTGDAGTGTERRLLERMQLENLTLLVAGHHGSNDSVSSRLLSSTDPSAVVISVGRNSYGLPGKYTLMRLKDFDCAVYRTDENGYVLMRCR